MNLTFLYNIDKYEDMRPLLDNISPVKHLILNVGFSNMLWTNKAS